MKNQGENLAKKIQINTAPRRPKTQKCSEDKELNQARSKPLSSNSPSALVSLAAGNDVVFDDWGSESILRWLLQTGWDDDADVEWVNWINHTQIHSTWLSHSLSPKFGLRPKISQKVKSFSLSDLPRPNFGLSDHWIQNSWVDFTCTR